MVGDAMSDVALDKEMNKKILLAVFLLFTAAGCAHGSADTLPSIDANSVTKIVVTFIRETDKTESVIENPARIEQILSSGAFSTNGWEIARERIAPHYRIDIFVKDVVVRSYVLGVNSDPPRFPCYELCTGWWIGYDDESNATILKKGLADTVWFQLSNDLFEK